MVSPAAGQEAGRRLVDGLESERPDDRNRIPAKDERTLRLDGSDNETVSGIRRPRERSPTSTRCSSGTIRSALGTPPLSRPSQLYQPARLHPICTSQGQIAVGQAHRDPVRPPDLRVRQQLVARMRPPILVAERTHGTPRDDAGDQGPCEPDRIMEAHRGR
jgi:hypothetical protein